MPECLTLTRPPMQTKGWSQRRPKSSLQLGKFSSILSAFFSSVTTWFSRLNIYIFYSPLEEYCGKVLLKRSSRNVFLDKSSWCFTDNMITLVSIEYRELLKSIRQAIRPLQLLRFQVWHRTHPSCQASVWIVSVRSQHGWKNKCRFSCDKRTKQMVRAGLKTHRRRRRKSDSRFVHNRCCCCCWRD